MKFLSKNKLLLSWIVSIIAMSGSLYFSEIKQFIPCEFCWYQRILMYPLVIILGIATFKKNKGIIIYVLPLTALGIIIGLIHYLQQKFLILGNSCSSFNPCSTMYINWYGFITIPFLSLTAFLIITFLLTLKK